MDLPYTINCKGRLIDLSKPKVMGILNATPDSFFDGSKFQELNKALAQVEKMLSEGATFIDIGGMSSRPGAEVITEEEELKRVIPIIEMAVKRFPEIVISIDTLRSSVARLAIESGAAIVNDISGGNYDKEMFNTVAQLQCPYILMHMQGMPNNMQAKPQYTNVTLDITKELSFKINSLKEQHVHDIILDPGFGFGKTVEQNFQLLRDLSHFKKLFDLPILVGLSRKSMIWKSLHNTPETALNGTTAANSIALVNGAKILRVHDVQAAMETIAIHQQTFAHDA